MCHLSSMPISPLSTRTGARQARPFRTVSVIAAVAAVFACGPKAAPPPSTPTVAAAPTVMQTCPDPTDGPSIVVNAVDEAHRALVANPSTPLPPVCVLTAFGRVARDVADSTNEHALALAAELRRRGTDQADLLSAEIVLLARARRYAEVSTTYDRLVAVAAEPPMEVSRLAIAAAHQRHDTTTLIRVLTK